MMLSVLISCMDNHTSIAWVLFSIYAVYIYFITYIPCFSSVMALKGAYKGFLGGLLSRH